jgi:hypothetical protein
LRKEGIIMTESKIETPFDKGARILNAMIAEVDIPADLKGNAQSVIRTLAEFLPQLLAPQADAPAAAATTTAPNTPEVPDDIDPGALFLAISAKAVEARASREHVEHLAHGNPTPRLTHKPAARRRGQGAEAATQPHGAVLAGLPEADVQLVWKAYEMVVGLQRNQAERLSEALIVALRGRVDAARVVEILTSTSIGAARLWRAALDDLAKA